MNGRRKQRLRFEIKRTTGANSVSTNVRLLQTIVSGAGTQHLRFGESPHIHSDP